MPGANVMGKVPDLDVTSVNRDGVRNAQHNFFFITITDGENEWEDNGRHETHTSFK